MKVNDIKAKAGIEDVPVKAASPRKRRIDPDWYPQPDDSATPSETVPLPPVEPKDYPQQKPSGRGSKTKSEANISDAGSVPKISKKASATPSGSIPEQNENADVQGVAGSTTPSTMVLDTISSANAANDTHSSATPSGTIPLPPVEDLMSWQQNHSTTPSGILEKDSTTPSGMKTEEPSQTPGVVEHFHYPQQNDSTTPSGFDPKAPKKKKTPKREIEILRGLQLEFMRYVFDKCSAEPPYRTPIVKLREVALATGSSENTADYNYGKLKEKGLIVRVGKDGPIVLEIPANIFTLVGKKLFTTPQRNHSATPSGIGPYARAVVVAPLEETQKPVAASDQSEGGTPSVGRSGATAERKPTTPTTTETPKSNRAEDWRRSDYLWAYSVVIPEIMKARGFRQAHMLEFERNDFDPSDVQRSVEEFASALEAGIDKKRKWKSPIAVFLEALRDKGYFSLDTSTLEEQDEKLKDARLDDLPFA